MKPKANKHYLAIVCSILGLVFLGVVLTGIVRVFKIPTSSMAPTLIDGDHVFSTKSFREVSEFSRNEAIIFRPPTNKDSHFIQRIAALPGDIVDLSGGLIAVNGTLLISPDGKHSKPARQPIPGVNPPHYPLTLKADEFFVVGDNYDNSLDSRYFGSIKHESITHIPRSIILPINRSGSLRKN